MGEVLRLPKEVEVGELVAILCKELQLKQEGHIFYYKGKDLSLKDNNELLRLKALKRINIVERVTLDFEKLGKREVPSVQKLRSVLSKQEVRDYAFYNEGRLINVNSSSIANRLEQGARIECRHTLNSLIRVEPLPPTKVKNRLPRQGKRPKSEKSKEVERSYNVILRPRDSE